MKRNTFYLLTHYVVLSTLPSHDQGQNADYTMLLCHTSVTIIYTDKVRVEIKATVLIISLGNLIYSSGIKSSGIKQHRISFLSIFRSQEESVTSSNYWLATPLVVILAKHPLSIIIMEGWGSESGNGGLGMGIWECSW